MAEKQDLKNIEIKIQAFYKLIRNRYPIKKIFLYGSWAKKTARPDSDVDIGVVIDFPQNKNLIKITAGLFHYSRMIDSMIEPRVILWKEFQNPASASILSEIIKTGIEIPLQEN